MSFHLCTFFHLSPIANARCHRVQKFGPRKNRETEIVQPGAGAGARARVGAGGAEPPEPANTASDDVDGVNTWRGDFGA